MAQGKLRKEMCIRDRNTATRTMTVDNTYWVDRNTYSTEKSKVDITKTSGTNGRQIADTEKNQGGTDTNVSFITNRFSPNYKNYRNDVNLSNYYTSNLSQYLQHTCSAWFYRYEMYAYEEVDGWEHAYIGSQALEDTHYKTSGKGAAVSDRPGQLWACLLYTSIVSILSLSTCSLSAMETACSIMFSSSRALPG